MSTLAKDRAGRFSNVLREFLANSPPPPTLWPQQALNCVQKAATSRPWCTRGPSTTPPAPSAASADACLPNLPAAPGSPPPLAPPPARLGNSVSPLAAPQCALLLGRLVQDLQRRIAVVALVRSLRRLPLRRLHRLQGLPQGPSVPLVCRSDTPLPLWDRGRLATDRRMGVDTSCSFAETSCFHVSGGPVTVR